MITEEQSCQLHRRLTALELEIGAAMTAMERLAFGVILLAEDRSAVFVNREARRILNQRDGLTLSRDGPAASNPQTTIALRGLIKDAMVTSRVDGPTAGGSLSAERPSMKRPLGLLVAPLSANRFTPAARCAVVAVFHLSRARARPLTVILVPIHHGLPGHSVDPGVLVALLIPEVEVGRQKSGQFLRDLYGLTQREADIAADLLLGHRVSDIARLRELSVNTVRTHLKRLLEKTGTTRQADLLRVLVASFPPVEYR
jgi:DNA-binding CsgD family transcriptional regulator